MASQGDDDLQASTTEGFKVGEKKTVEEYAKLGKWDNGRRGQLQYMVYGLWSMLSPCVSKASPSSHLFAFVHSQIDSHQRLSSALGQSLLDQSDIISKKRFLSKFHTLCF